ncbi:MAG: K+/H+ antiporter subunit F [Rubrivivax sp.]
MIEWALDFAFVALAAATVLCAWRLLRGPDLVDRVLALDTLYVNAAALAVLVGVQMQSRILFETALIVALLGFVATVALARFVVRGDVLE